MALMMGKLHAALLAADVPADVAREAAEEAASNEARFSQIDTRFASVEGRLALLSWMVGFNIALTVAILAMLLRAGVAP